MQKETKSDRMREETQCKKRERKRETDRDRENSEK